MNNNLLDSTKKAGMHISKYTYLLSHVCRIAGAASQRSNSQASVWVQKSHLLCVTCRNLHLAPQVCNRLSRILIILEHLILRISGTRHISINALVLAALSV